MTKICVFGEKDCEHTEMILELFSQKHDVTWFVEDIGTAREISATSLISKIKVSYNPIELEYQDAFIICNESVFDILLQKVDSSKLKNNVELVKRYARENTLVILESIVGIGTTRKFFESSKLNAAYCPSRSDTNMVGVHPSEIPKLLGGINEKSEKMAMHLYTSVFNVIVRTGKAEIAEGAILLEKSNAIVQKAFLNEFADFCQRIDLDVHHVIDAASTGIMKKHMPCPWIGNKTNDMSARHLVFHEKDWPVLQSAMEQMERRPKQIYEKIVERYCGKNNYDELHKKCFLMVGLGDKIGSSNMRNSPVMEIITSLELEGAKVEKFDLFIEKYSKVPKMEHNSGLPKFDGIIVFHPYLISKWEKYNYTTFFCRH